MPLIFEREWITLRNVMKDARKTTGAGPISIGQLCRLAGCTPRTVRFYEELGIIAPIARTPGGHKLYDAGGARVISLAKALGQCGCALTEVKRLLGLSHSKRTAGRWLTGRLRKELSSIVSSVDARLARLEGVRQSVAAVLDETQGCATCSAKDCAACGNLTRLRTLGAQHCQEA
jgi:DNA-binding transcriptional MerR regulator